MTTLERLQKHIEGEILHVAGYDFKNCVPHIKCKDGTTISVQASEYHYCSPRTHNGPYHQVEVWCIPEDVQVSEFEYNVFEPSAYVPIEAVVKFIDNHGGFSE